MVKITIEQAQQALAEDMQNAMAKALTGYTDSVFYTPELVEKAAKLIDETLRRHTKPGDELIVKAHPTEPHTVIVSAPISLWIDLGFEVEPMLEVSMSVTVDPQ